MRVLVTGGSGFIGTHLVTDLLRHGHQVISVDRVPAREVSNVTQRSVDLLDRAALIATFRETKPDAVVHLAARTDLDERRNLAGYAANIEGVENLVAAVRAVPEIRRTLVTSSQLVCRVGYVPRTDDDYQPDTLYGASKVRTERIIRAEHIGNVEWCIVRPTTVWGPGMRDHYLRFFRMIEDGRYFHIGRRPLYKSYGYVGNVVYQYRQLLMAAAPDISGRTLYLADYEPLALRRWADEIQRQMGAPPIRSVPERIARVGAMIGDGLNRLGWRSFPFNSFLLRNILTEYVFDLAPTAAICGALPYSMDEGVAALVSSLRETHVRARSQTDATSSPHPNARPVPNRHD
jgi:GlcNAc-P-P-Und epimerase